MSSLSSSRHSCRQTLTFNASGAAKPPEVVTPLSDQSGETGRNAKFECEFTGFPRPEFRWFRGVKELVDTSKYTLINKGEKQVPLLSPQHFLQVLIVGDLQPEDADEYTCRASNAAGTKSTRASLQIKSKPKIFIPPRYHGGLEAEKGQTVELKIPFKAFPSAQSRWFRDGEKIEEGGKYTVITEDR